MVKHVYCIVFIDILRSKNAVTLAPRGPHLIYLCGISMVDFLATASATSLRILLSFIRLAPRLVTMEILLIISRSVLIQLMFEG